jgi:hypothetical protein
MRDGGDVEGEGEAEAPIRAKLAEALKQRRFRIRNDALMTQEIIRNHVM